MTEEEKSETLFRPLTRKQLLFVDAYLGEAHGSASEAAKLAGYKGNRQTLNAVGSENLRKPSIVLEIKKRIDETTKPVNPAEVIEFFAKVMRDESHHISHRHRAAESLAKVFALFSEHRVLEVSGKVEMGATKDKLRSILEDPSAIDMIQSLEMQILSAVENVGVES